MLICVDDRDLLVLQIATAHPPTSSLQFQRQKLHQSTRPFSASWSFRSLSTSCFFGSTGGGARAAAASYQQSVARVMAKYSEMQHHGHVMQHVHIQILGIIWNYGERQIHIKIQRHRHISQLVLRFLLRFFYRFQVHPPHWQRDHRHRRWCRGRAGQMGGLDKSSYTYSILLYKDCAFYSGCFCGNSTDHTFVDHP